MSRPSSVPSDIPEPSTPSLGLDAIVTLCVADERCMPEIPIQRPSPMPKEEDMEVFVQLKADSNYSSTAASSGQAAISEEDLSTIAAFIKSEWIRKCRPRFLLTNPNKKQVQSAVDKKLELAQAKPRESSSSAWRHIKKVIVWGPVVTRRGARENGTLEYVERESGSATLSWHRWESSAGTKRGAVQYAMPVAEVPGLQYWEWTEQMEISCKAFADAAAKREAEEKKLLDTYDQVSGPKVQSEGSVVEDDWLLIED